MVDKTPRLDLDDYDVGDAPWDHSDLVTAVDEHAIARGPIADRPASGDYDDEMYYAVDQELLWRWDADASDWVGVSGKGSASQPLPGTVHREAVNTEEAQFKDRATFGQSLTDFGAGRTTEGTWNSWPANYAESMANYPTNRDRPVVIFSSEGTRPEEYTEAYPRFKERNLPWMKAVTPSRLDSSDGLSTTNLNEMVAHGCSVGHYPGSNNLYDISDLEELEDVIIGQKRQLEEMGYSVQTFMPRNKDGSGYTQPNEAISNMIRSNYLVEGHSNILGSGRSATKRIGNVMSTFGTIDADLGNGMTVQDYKDEIDMLVDRRDGDVLWLFFHSRTVTNNNQWTEMEEIMDYVTQKRDAGQLDVRTPTAAQLNYDREELNLVNESSPVTSTFADSLWREYAAEPSIANYPDDPYYVFGDSQGAGIRFYKASPVPFFNTFMLEFEARCPTGETNNEIRAEVNSLDTPSVTKYLTIPDDTWTTMHAPFSSKRWAEAWDESAGVPGAEMRLHTWGAITAHVKNIKMYPC